MLSSVRIRYRDLQSGKLSSNLDRIPNEVKRTGVRMMQIADLQREERDVKHHLYSNLNEGRQAPERELTIEKLQTQKRSCLSSVGLKKKDICSCITQGDIERQKSKLAMSERAAKIEAQLEDKLKSCFRSLEERLKHVLTLTTSQNFGYSYSIGIPGKHSIPLQEASLTVSKLSESLKPNFGRDDSKPETGGVQEGRCEGMMASGALYGTSTLH
ncbi:hypothetical protein HPP92_005737 [Vanilla planifolia]|uniref:Uncharacterized protein n=1 Tax=Vanilla planifolia TaxID=51239 RepID=A0A835RV67_VANPL|nr:hypothetical protein HPP92_006040 [Vanilla planifolia]KAG0494743.1 hypothetical protein HPP92_005737 [Vanilla planifolia]